MSTNISIIVDNANIGAGNIGEDDIRQKLTYYFTLSIYLAIIHSPVNIFDIDINITTNNAINANIGIITTINVNIGDIGINGDVDIRNTNYSIMIC